MKTLTHKVWNEAKELARLNFEKADWSRVMDVYHYLKGNTKQFTAYNEDGIAFRVLGVANDTYALVCQAGDDSVQFLERDSIERMQKSFRDIEEPLTLSLTVPNEIKREIEGSLFITCEMDKINV